MTARYTVRRARLADAEPVAVMHLHTWRATYAGIIPDEVLARLDLASWVERKRRSYGSPRPGAVNLVAEDHAGTVVGLANAGPYRLDGDRDRPAPDADEVYGLYVHPEHWGRGAGRVLLDATLAALPAVPGRPVRLWVLADNARARRFYERYGFRADGTVAAISYDGTMSFSGDGDLAEVRYSLRR